MSHKRNKRSRLRGRRTCGWGSRKKHRGSGQRGGVGMAGTGKKAGQKINVVAKIPNYFGKHGFKSLRIVQKKKPEAINLKNIEKSIDSYLKSGIAKKTKEGIEINLEGYKILGEGELKEKVIIKADSASKQALEKVKKSGSIIVFEESKEKEE